MPYKKDDNWFNDKGERIRHPEAYFKAAGLDEEYERIREGEIDKLADKAESEMQLKAERKNELEREGYSSEEEYRDAYYAGETDGTLSEPADYPEPEPDDYEENHDTSPESKPDDYIPRNHDEDIDDYSDSSDFDDNF